MRFQKYLVIGLIILFLACGIFISRNYFLDKNADNSIKEKFESDAILLKVSVDEFGETNNNIKIKNIYSEKSHFSLKILQLENLVSIDEPEFDLEPNEEKNIKISFKTDREKPGVYLGELEINSGDEIKKIPIILEIQSKEVFFDSNINLYPQGSDIISGEKLNTEIKIFDLSNTGRRNINIHYFIKDFNGGTIISDSESLIVENILDYFKTINLPQNTNPGDYVLITLAEYNNSTGVSSLYFKISGDGKIEEDIFEKNIIFILLIFSFLFFIFISFLIYYLFSRDKLLKELETQYHEEIKKQEGKIREKEKEIIIKLKTPAEKKEFKKEVSKVRKNRISALKETHKKRIEELKKIKKKGDEIKLKKQLEEWKSKGYDTSILEDKFKLPSASEIRKKAKEWKSKGYDTSILEK